MNNKLETEKTIIKIEEKRQKCRKTLTKNGKEQN